MARRQTTGTIAQQLTGEFDAMGRENLDFSSVFKFIFSLWAGQMSFDFPHSQALNVDSNFMTEYTDIQTGAFGLLYDTTKLLNELGVKYIIIGGWTPFLLNSKPILHPGTKDVDVLFDGAYEKG